MGRQSPRARGGWPRGRLCASQFDPHDKADRLNARDNARVGCCAQAITFRYSTVSAIAAVRATMVSMMKPLVLGVPRPAAAMAGGFLSSSILATVRMTLWLSDVWASIGVAPL